MYQAFPVSGANGNQPAIATVTRWCSPCSRGLTGADDGYTEGSLGFLLRAGASGYGAEGRTLRTRFPPACGG